MRYTTEDNHPSILLRQKLAHRLPELEDLLDRFCGDFSTPYMVSKNTLLIRADDASTHLHFIIQGTVAEFGEDDRHYMTVPQVFGPGEFVLNVQRHTTLLPAKSTYRCLTPVRMVVMDQETLHAFQRDLEFGEVFFVIQQHLLAQVRTHFLHLLKLSPSEHYSWILTQKPWMAQALTRNQMAAFLGVSRATFFRLLSKYRLNS